MKDAQLQQQGLLDSRQTLSLYLETLFRQDVVDQEKPIKNQSIPAKKRDMEVMLVRFGRHKLALPVKDLKVVIKLGNSSLRRLPGQAAYILGTIFHNDKDVPVYDLNWIFNSHNGLHKPDNSLQNPNPTQVIVLKGENMAIACDGSDEILNLKQYDIRWNKQQGKNLWLQGIVLQHMASLLNLREIKRVFRNGLELGEKQGALAPA